MTLKMSTFKWVHVLLLQLNSGISLPSPDLCNSALYLPVMHMLRTFTFPLQQCQRPPIRRGLICVDQPWNLQALHIIQKFTHKAIGGFGVTT